VKQRLDEALGLAVRAWSAGLDAQVAQAELAESVGVLASDVIVRVLPKAISGAH